MAIPEFDYQPFWQSIRINTAVAKEFFQQLQQILAALVQANPIQILSSEKFFALDAQAIGSLASEYAKSIGVGDVKPEIAIQAILGNSFHRQSFTFFYFNHPTIEKLIILKFRQFVAEEIFIKRAIPLNKSNIEQEVLECFDSSIGLYQAAAKACLSRERNGILSPQGTFDLLKIGDMEIEANVLTLPCDEAKGFKVDAQALREFLTKNENKGKLPALSLLAQPTLLEKMILEAS